MNNLSTSEAEQALSRAKQTREEQRRADLLEKLADVRAQLADLGPQFAKMKNDVFALQASFDNLHKQLQTRNEAVDDWHAARPRVADFLSADPEVAAWQAELERRQARVSETRNQLRALPNLMRLRIEGVELAQRIQGLRFEESNLMDAIAGSTRALATGGVFGAR